jgi:hypothetical protein
MAFASPGKNSSTTSKPSKVDGDFGARERGQNPEDIESSKLLGWTRISPTFLRAGCARDTAKVAAS